METGARWRVLRSEARSRSGGGCVALAGSEAGPRQVRRVCAGCGPSRDSCYPLLCAEQALD